MVSRPSVGSGSSFSIMAEIMMTSMATAERVRMSVPYGSP